MSNVRSELRLPLVAAPADFVPFPIEAIEQSLADRFEWQVRCAPGRTAIVARTATLSYAELNARANGIAAAVLAASRRRDLPVAVLLEHGAMQAAAILGVLKAGRPYVGLDPQHEPHSHGRTLMHCGADLLVCDAHCRAQAARLRLLWTAAALTLIDIDAPDAAPRDDNPIVARRADDPAYIYYTSGTTGVPKGVLDNQRNVLHNVMRYTNNLGIAPSDRLSLLQSVAFSGAVSSLFCALLNGAASLPVDLRAEGTVGAAEWLDRCGATIYHSVPSIFERLVASGRKFARLRVIRLEGDLASPRHVALLHQHFGPGVTLVNGLGATETGISHQWTCHHGEHTPALAAASVVPVGRPCEGMRGLIVDASGNELPAGEVGEVAIRSRYLALGYWRQPELTAARFTEDPAGGAERTYRTGDLGRFNPDGCLELLGRTDRNFKLHGRWIDLPAVEAALMRCDGVREAVAMVRGTATGGSELVAYLVPHPDSHPARHPDAGRNARPGIGELRAAIETPDAPATAARFVWLDELPLDANGKVRRDDLPEPPRLRPAVQTPFVPPAEGIEQTLARLWCEVLVIDEIGAHDDFAELGGDSLRAIDLVTRVVTLFGLEHQAARLIESATIAAMAQQLTLLRHPQ